jgi:hypothetical protein
MIKGRILDSEMDDKISEDMTNILINAYPITLLLDK